MAKIHGFVRDASDKPLGGVVLTFVGKRTGDEDKVKTSNKGEYLTKSLKNGDYEWVAEKEGHVPSRGLFRLRGTAEIVENEPIVLERAGSISGRVTNQAGAAIQGAQVTVTDSQNQIAGQAATDANGDYAIPNLLPGPHRVSVQAPAGFQNPAAINVNVQGGVDAGNSNFQLAAAVQTGSVSGQVTDKTGKGVQGREVRVTNAQDQVAGKVQTDANGKYTIQNLPAASYTVTVVDVAGQPSFLPAHNVEVIAGAATLGIDFAEDVVKDFLGRLDDARFSIESLISKDEANQAVSLFSVVNLMLAGLSRRRVGSKEKLDVLGMSNLYYGLQEGSLRDKITVGDSTALWSNLESELRNLAKDLDQLQSDVDFLNREAKRQFNLGMSNNVLANVRFPALFRRYVEIGSDPLLSFDIKAADQNRFFNKTKIAQADELLKELKGVVLQIVRSLSKYGTAATKRVNEDWAKFEARALEVLSIVARDRVTPDQDEQNIWSVLAALVNKNRETEIAPHVVLARHGGKLLKLAMDTYIEIESKAELDVFDPGRLRDLFQRGNIQKEFLTEKIREQATFIKRYPLPNWG